MHQNVVFSPLEVDPADAAIMHPQGLLRWSLYTQNKFGPWPSGFIVMRMRSATNELSHYIILYQTWGESVRLWGESMTTAILASLVFPYGLGFP